MSKLKNYCLNITDGEHGSIIDDPDGDYYFLNNNNITEDGIVINPNDRRMSKKEFERINKRTQLSTNDVVIATCGTLGKTQVITDTSINYDFSRSVGIIKTDPQKLLPLFLHYYFKNPHTQKRIERIAEGAVQKHFYIGAMEDFEVEIPDIGIQKDIILAISKIDGKISNNKSICSDLESMAKLLYDYWFVQFDFPDENGKSYKSSGGKMVWNEELKREIPDGWEVKRLVDLARYSGDKVLAASLSCENYIGMDNLLPNMKGRESSEYTPTSGYTIGFCAGDVLLGNIRPYFKKIWLSDIDGGCSPDVLVIRSKSKGDTAFVYSSLARDDFFAYDTAGAKGSKMPRGDKDHIMNYPIAYNKAYVEKFESIVKGWLKKRNEYYFENQQLASLRDFLLPMLMNGQVKIKER